MLGEVKNSRSVHSDLFLDPLEIIIQYTSESLRALILILQSSALMSSSHLLLSGNFAKARIRFKVSDQRMKGLPHGLLPLTNWENIMLLSIRVAFILISFAAHANVRLTRMTRRVSIPKVL